MKYLMTKNKADIILQGIYRAIYPSKCLFCRVALDDKNAYACAGCAVHGSAPYAYNDITKRPVHALKYSGIKTLARPMARAIYEGLAADIYVDILLPVPLHENRLKERGFNQAVLLALELSSLLGLPVIDGLKRVRDTAPQHSLSHDKRVENLRDAIVVKEGFEAAGLRILLVDDIFTTGATSDECKRALEQAGAKSVELITFAKA